MSSENIYDVIIVGGSYSGLAAGMALGRSLRKVLIIDSGKPCNQQTPQSHNFITQDGTPPAEIARQAKAQVALYPTVTFVDGVATTACGFWLSCASFGFRPFPLFQCNNRSPFVLFSFWLLSF